MKKFELLELVIGGCDSEDCHCEESSVECEESVKHHLHPVVEAAEPVELVEVL